MEEKEHTSVTDPSDTVDKKVTGLVYSYNCLRDFLDFSKGRSPVLNGCRWDNLRALNLRLKLLLEAGFEPVQEDREGLTMFQVAMAPENYAKDCALYLLSVSKEVRRRAEVTDEDRERDYVVISCDGKEKIIVDRNIDWDVIEDIQNSGSQTVEGSAVTKVGQKPAVKQDSEVKRGSAPPVPLPGIGVDYPSFLEALAEWQLSLAQ